MYCPRCDQKPMNCECTALELRMHAEIEGLREQVPQWIPVSERLPDRNENVLIYIPAAAEKTYIASLDEGGMWFSSDPTADAYSLGEDGAPTHWMPLPEPPEVK